jgi:hypothetical protein
MIKVYHIPSYTDYKVNDNGQPVLEIVNLLGQELNVSVNVYETYIKVTILSNDFERRDTENE